ncbi:MAG: hypothetical protein JXC32_01640 [Anaerolineae bacterium]|nr:hypothetical protein [Anaerolineae bacterium]
MTCEAETAARRTVVSIDGDAFLLNGVPTYPGRTYQGRKIEGLLLNSRMVQGIFDDLNPETRDGWRYPDGSWDPERNTDEFVAAMPQWRRAGLVGFTINLQGGSPQGYSQEQPWHNSAFTPEGDLRDAYMNRLTRILDAADRLEMAVILGYFYFGQDQRFLNELCVIRATENATDWLLDKGYTNVLIEIGNEVDNRKYDQPVLKVDRCHELIDLVKARSAGQVATPQGRLLVSASLCGGKIPTENIVATSDFLLLHGNGVSEPDRIREMVDTTRQLPSYRGQPILFNEDDHFDFEADDNNMLAALDRYAGWGYFDFRMAGEGYHEGYQSVPVDWTISSERKRGFFNLLRKVTGSED